MTKHGLLFGSLSLLLTATAARAQCGAFEEIPGGGLPRINALAWYDAGAGPVLYGGGVHSNGLFSTEVALLAAGPAGWGDVGGGASSFLPSALLEDGIADMVEFGGRLYLCGDFSRVSGVDALSLASFDGTAVEPAPLPSDFVPVPGLGGGLGVLASGTVGGVEYLFASDGERAWAFDGASWAGIDLSAAFDPLIADMVVADDGGGAALFLVGEDLGASAGRGLVRYRDPAGPVDLALATGPVELAVSTSALGLDGLLLLGASGSGLLQSLWQGNDLFPLPAAIALDDAVSLRAAVEVRGPLGPVLVLAGQGLAKAGDLEPVALASYSEDSGWLGLGDVLAEPPFGGAEPGAVSTLAPLQRADGDRLAIGGVFFEVQGVPAQNSALLIDPGPIGVENLGGGCPGSVPGGPLLAAGGCSSAGGMTAFTVRAGVPGEPGVLAFASATGATPLFTGCVSPLANPVGPLLTFVLGAEGSAAPGSFTFDLEVPPGLAPALLYAQAVLFDPLAAAPEQLASTNALLLKLP